MTPLLPLPLAATALPLAPTPRPAGVANGTSTGLQRVPGSQPATNGGGRRYIRSREGCLTCKRRKVKCDEQRPRCSHCERLNMECKWRPQSRTNNTNNHRRRSQTVQGNGSSSHNTVAPSSASPATDASTGTAAGGQNLPIQHAVDEVFDYASFMWDAGGDFWQQASPVLDQNVGLNAQIMGADAQINFPDRLGLPSFTPPQANDFQPVKLALSPDSEKLMDYFFNSGIPPILAEVEAHKKWLAMRQVVTDMARSSNMVHCAILAFSNMLLCRRDGTWGANEQYYAEAVSEITTHDTTDLQCHSTGRERLLAALFFLSYVDILESRLDAAHSHLKRAYTIFQKADNTTFVPVEKQLLLWIRLLDGRAVSAGGDGLFLSKDDEVLLVETSPASLEGDADDHSKHEVTDGDIEDVLFQVLYQPGVVFYQKVQSFMGRISMIDPWHRSRGTVEDETDVMNIGAGIATDLRTLYDQRPPLMDYAVSGKLSEPHISAHLAFVIARAFRTYLSNYYASKIHLHRVAYKALPLTSEATEALDNIRKLARQIVADSDPDDSLPVNMLWPLLMLGVEEQDVNEKAWIKTQILRMEKVAGNAKITAQVLEEVQARQDAAKARMDIRSIMHAVFNACFAIT